MTLDSLAMHANGPRIAKGSTRKGTYPIISQWLLGKKIGIGIGEASPVYLLLGCPDNHALNFRSRSISASHA
jgi:hypothetical protein